MGELMKRKKNPDKNRTCSAGLAYPLMISLLLTGCSYYNGQFSSFDFTDEKNLAGKQAAKKFWASVRPKSTLSDAHYRLGLHYQQMGEHDKAIGEFTRALRFDRGYCKAYNGIAMTYDLQKRCEPAHASYEQAVQCAPGETYVYNNYACSSLLCGDYEKGMDLLRKAEVLAGNDTRIKNNLRIARSIAIHENISDFKTEEPHLPPAAESGVTAAQPPPENKRVSPDPVCTIPADFLYAVSHERYMSKMPKDQQLESIAAIAAGTSNRQTERSEVSHSNDLFAGKSINPVTSQFSSSPSKTVAVEVSNGNGATGMAKRSADFLRGQGFTVRSVTNAKHFRFEESVIYYKEEYLQAAKDLAAAIPGAQNLEKVNTMAKPSIGIRVLLGRDLVSIQFPEDYYGLADYRQIEQFEPPVLTASKHMVEY